MRSLLDVTKAIKTEFRKIRLNLLYGRTGSQSLTRNPETKLPPELVWGVVTICVLPSLLNWFGVDFSSISRPLDLQALPGIAPEEIIDATHHALAGSFTHTLLEWSAFCTAIFTVILAFAHFSTKQDVTTPTIAVTLFFAGVMDAFHTLAADRLIEAVADNRNLIPFTWAICRLCNVVLTIIGVSLFLSNKPRKWQQNVSFVLAATLVFGGVAYSIIHFCATSAFLPETTFPNSTITRPWDVTPLVLFAIAGIFIYPRFHQKHQSLFSHALIVSTIPNAATQIHMAFGSSALFDNHFNIAHFLKIIAYMVPLAGLILDYIQTHRHLERANRDLNEEITSRQAITIELERSQCFLKEKNNQVEKALRDLQKTHLQLIQAEKMSGLGTLVAGIAHEINNPINFVSANLTYVNEYASNLLYVIELYRERSPEPDPEIEEALKNLEIDFTIKDLSQILESMNGGTKRISELVVSMRNFSRLDEADLKKSDLHEGIDSTLVILNHKLKNRIALVKDYGQLPLIRCYPAQLNQVFMNLLSNAIYALEELANTESLGYKPQIAIETKLLLEDRVKIKIQDNGPGIDPETQAKIFDPFFTTKPIGSGTGLGLSISYQIIEKHQGQITVKSELGRGTEFTIILPV